MEELISSKGQVVIPRGLAGKQSTLQLLGHTRRLCLVPQIIPSPQSHTQC